MFMSNNERDRLHAQVEEQYAALSHTLQLLTAQLTLIEQTAEQMRTAAHDSVERLLAPPLEEEPAPFMKSERTFSSILDLVRKKILHPKRNAPQIIPDFQQTTLVALARLNEERWREGYGIMNRSLLLIVGCLLENQGYSTYARLAGQTGYAVSQMRPMILSHLQRFAREADCILEGSDETGWKLSTREQAQQAWMYQI